jgi:DNA ligase (NAD+)
VNVECQNGEPVNAILRNDGIEGEDIFRNFCKMRQQFVTNKTKEACTENVHAEILLYKKDLEEINKLQEIAGEKSYANCRNAAAGIARRFDGKYSEYLEVMPFEVNTANLYVSDFDRLKSLDYGKDFRLGIDGKRYAFTAVCTMWEEIRQGYIVTLAGRERLPYVIDGIVIKINELAKRTDHSERPDWIRAMKFPPEAKTFRVDDIEWFVGKIGHVTPVIVNKLGVQFQDKVVKNVTLHNYEQFCRHKLAPGDKISVVIAGDVIPKIESVLQRSGEPLFIVPKNCPECGSILRVEEKFLVCDSDGCPGRIEAMINAFIKEMGIEEVGEETVEKLLELGRQGEIKFDHYPDLFLLKAQDLLKVEGYASGSVAKVLANIHAKKQVELPKFIAALGIPNVGDKVIEKLGVTSLDELMAMKDTEMIKKEGIGELTAARIIHGLARFTPLIGLLLSAGVSIIQPKKIERQSKILEGESYCFTGDTNVVNPLTMKKFDRDELWELVKQHGGIVKTGVSKKLNNLVLVDINSQTSKARKAREYQINIMTDIQFLTKIGIIK